MQNVLTTLTPSTVFQLVTDCVDDFDDQGLITIGDYDEIKQQLVNHLNHQFTNGPIDALHVHQGFAHLRAQLWVEPALSATAKATLAQILNQLMYLIDTIN